MHPDEQTTLILLNREYGLTTPRALPKPFKDLNADERKISMWYVRNLTSYMDKAAVARHIIGSEIISYESGEIPVQMTEQRAKDIWDWVFVGHPFDPVSKQFIKA